jgi:hypothetical protein
MPVIDMIDVESSQIHSIGHDQATETLAVRFYRGWGDNRRPDALYHYQNVPSAEFEALRDAESIGKHFGQRIKPFPLQYPYTKVEDAPADDLPTAA